MKTSLLVALAVFLGMSAAASTSRFKRCPVQGQLFYKKCRPCLGTCENPRPICPCTRGCACPLGTVLDTEVNACVSPKQCPTGRNCRQSDGSEIEDGDSYQPNPCTYCQCDNGKLSCVVQDCAAPPCDDYTVPPGQCCPVCPRSCELSNGTSVPHGTNYQPDPCTFCLCNNGELACLVRDCAAPSCDDYIVPPGECCPVCPNPTLPAKCAAVLCQRVDCPNATIPKGECCAVCPEEEEPTLPPECAAVLCLAVDCPDATIPEGECCAVCPEEEESTLPPECAAVLCLAVDCPDATIPEGECCAVCPKPSLPPKCAAVLCLAVDCPSAVIPKGQCCAVCPDEPGTLPPKCAAVTCLAVDCPGAVVPKGECCAVCPHVCEYNGQVYQPGDSFPSSDGCNTCFCAKSGLVGCTKKACLPKLMCPKPTGVGICVDLCAPGFACGPGQKCCSNGCGHACTNATDCALVDCAPTPCDFPGGVVIPAGEDECCSTCGCMSGGTTYRVGESFPAGDGCNTCSCTSGGIRCTLIACTEPKA